MKTPEGKVKAAVKKLLGEYSVYYFMPVQNGMGKPGLDFHCHLHGVAFSIETKAPGKKPTPRQEVTIADMEASGAMVFVIDDCTSEALAPLKDYLDYLEALEPILRRIHDSRPNP